MIGTGGGVSSASVVPQGQRPQPGAVARAAPPVSGMRPPPNSRNLGGFSGTQTRRLMTISQLEVLAMPALSTLDFKDALSFANQNQACWLATSQDDQPHVRGLLMWFADQ